jgi:hypothetical protein
MSKRAPTPNGNPAPGQLAADLFRQAAAAGRQTLDRPNWRPCWRGSGWALHRERRRGRRSAHQPQPHPRVRHGAERRFGRARRRTRRRQLPPRPRLGVCRGGTDRCRRLPRPVQTHHRLAANCRPGRSRGHDAARSGAARLFRWPAGTGRRPMGRRFGCTAAATSGTESGMRHRHHRRRRRALRVRPGPAAAPAAPDRQDRQADPPEVDRHHRRLLDQHELRPHHPEEPDGQRLSQGSTVHHPPRRNRDRRRALRRGAEGPRRQARPV